MITFASRWQWVVVLGVLLGFAATPVWALEFSANNMLQAPSSEPRFKPGDTVQVATEGARLMLGKEVIAELQQGQPIVVVEVQHPWIGTYVLSDNQKKIGWVRTKEFIPVNSPARAEPVPAVQASAAPRVVAVSRAAIDSDFMVGKYDRHEVDPNVHTWEPWRR